MLIFKNLMVVAILIAKIVHTASEISNNVGSNDSDLDELRKVFIRNLQEDVRSIEEKYTERTSQFQQSLNRRIEAFSQAFDTDYGTTKTSSLFLGENVRNQDGRRVPRAVNEAIEQDTAQGEHWYLKGFRERSYVPVNHPIDICLLKVGKSVFAASLNKRKTKDIVANHTIVSFFVWNRDIKAFHKYKEYTGVLARKFDCISHASLGFVAVVNFYDSTQKQVTPPPNRKIDDGSPVFQIMENGNTEIVQKFSQSNQNTVHMWVHGNHIYLTHTYTNLDESVANVCPLYRWSGYHFDAIDELPCYNSIHIEPFTIEQTLFLAIANQMNDEAVDEDTFSDLFKFDYDRQKFDFHQKIYIYSVSHIAYIFMEMDHKREHFLVTGNSRAGKKNKAGKLDYDQHSIMYKYMDGYFVPFQKFELYSVKQFLPVMRINGEFLLLIMCRGRPLLIYEYDGWKFSPSQIDYTREAFSVGVSHMRVYQHMVNASLIVIANRNSFGTTTNIFSPIYGVKNDLKDVYREFIAWCDDTTQQLASLDLEEIYNRLVELPGSGDSTVTLDKNVEMRDSTIQELHTEALHVGDFVFDQRTFDYLNKVQYKLESLEKKAEELSKIVDGSFKLNETLEINGDLKIPEIIAPDALVGNLEATYVNGEITKRSISENHYEEAIYVDDLIVEENLEVKFINGYASETLLHTTDDFRLLKDVKLHVPEVEINGELFVQNLIDGIRFTEDNVLIDGKDQVFTNKTLRVDKLVVKNLVASKLNSTDTDVIMAYAQRSSKPCSSQYREIHVNDLEITGLINDVDFNHLAKHALQKTGNQTITGEWIFDKVYASRIIVPNERLSGVELNSLVLTEPTGNQSYFTVRQDVQFTEPVYFESLQVDERVNHIPVIDGKLQVLLQNSDEPQLMTGTKTFDNVKLLSPIDLRGKINGSSLSKLNPIQTIQQDVYLEGDYEIIGNVTVELLNTSNIYGASRTYNFNDLYTHGLPLNTAAINQNFIFRQPLIADSVFSSSLNGLDPSDFVRTKSNKVQHITGKKIFTGDLNIEGHIEAAVINDVDIDYLNRTVLKRTGEQVVEGSIHFKKIILSRAVSNRTWFGGQPLSTDFETNANGRAWSKVRFENCNLTIEGDLSVGDLLATNGSTVYGYDLDYLMQDTLQISDEEVDPETITGTKYFRNMTIGEVIFDDQATLNGIDMERLAKIGESFQNNTLIFDSLEMDQPLYVRNVFFNGSLNGVHKDEFGNSWLLNEYNQTFTAPQTFEHVIADQIILDGYLNGVKIEELVENVYYLNENEYVKRAIFHNGVISHQMVTVNGLVSGLKLETDVLLDSPIQHQYLKELRVDGELRVTDKINIVSTLNGINYGKLQEFVSSSGTDIPLKIEVQGNVHFVEEPEIVELNGYNLQQLHRDVWLTNRDEVLTGRYRFEDVRFDSYVHTKGPINGLDLDEISETYLSLTKEQVVTTPLIFKGPVEFRNNTNIKNIVLKGLLKGSEDSKGFDIVDYDRHVLKKNVEQTITGHWTFHEVEVLGSLNLTTINGLDLQKDILLNNVPEATFTGNKRFKDLHVRNLKCEAPCVIQGVDFTEWFANSVRLDRNATIEGITYLEAPTIIGDIECLGPVNNITFDEDHLLLKSTPQTIKGNLIVKTKFPEKNLIYPLTIEKLEVKTINGKNFNEFVKNLARVDQNPLTINTSVTLTQPLETENLDIENNMLYGVDMNKLLQKSENEDQLKTYESKFRHLDLVGQSLVDTFQAKTPHLSHFQPMKSLEGHFGTVDTITIPKQPQPVQLLVVHVVDKNRTAVEFYRWNKKDSQFRIAKGFAPISLPKLIVANLKTITLRKTHYLYVEFYSPKYQYYRQKILSAQPTGTTITKKIPKFLTLYEFNSTTSRDIVAIKLYDLDCIGLFSSLANGMEIHCLHRESQEIYPIMKLHQSIATPAVRQALYLQGRLILLSRDNHLQIWRPQLHYTLILAQLVQIDHPSFITAAYFDYQFFIAINSEPKLADGVYHGSIEIWRDLRAQQRNSTLTKYQSIVTEVPVQIRFSVLPSTADLMLYIFSDSKFHPLVIYQYEGVTGFRQYLRSNTLRTTATRLKVLKMQHSHSDMLALIGKDRIDLIEAIIEGQ
ncbi:uncharacterized protein LOC129722051 [Wyeomyia smithii]|uniref:uncharacterized protein LOC129722051 n=1 Tax=Wyeomyia smithii TaxID=174621 RepID=UPI002467FB6F|nr:uncharacterized protein LOC129722051 [Wyeomyia smithii]